MTTLVDSNVLLDIATSDPRWGTWSSTALARAADNGLLAINPLIYAEVSIGFATIEDLDEALPPEFYLRTPLPYEAAFLAGKAFLACRRRGGTKTAPLPDFYIGAHAAVAGCRLLTRDSQRYTTYFPTIELIAP
jgi:predicted nucleic acid-binding protein